MEKINIPKKEDISNIDNSRRFESVREEVFDYQLQYVEKLYSGEFKQKIEKDKDIGDLVMDFSYLKRVIYDECLKRIPNFEKMKKDKIDQIIGYTTGVISRQINDSYLKDKKQWKYNIKEISLENLNKIGPEINKLPEKSGPSAGLIHFNVKGYEELEKFGISDMDDCLEIHFEELYKQKEKDSNLKSIFSGDSLSILASKIVDEYPQVKAITANSWLVDSPIGKRIGFIVSGRKEQVSGNEGFWGQFIDENGKLNKERMNKFIKTGIPDFYTSKGFIKTEDFLKKYLPKEKRGNIILKEISEESKEFRKYVEFISKEIDEKWDTLSYEEICDLFYKNEAVYNYLQTDKGKRYLEMLKKAKELKINKLDNFVYDYKDDIKNDLRDFIKQKSNEYIEKEIFIP
ncbi:TPA: hypothetical protein DIC38_01645 [Candidatus Nomurabacteria bacterium]|nr:MAG: hypothetical protein O210_OD1C00001G0401 [Parcubacteria bacterium RAAC4_OD1_1]HCY26365.1 hypothetical protein [Candidatus Nomurabacteria bacterium]